MATLTPTKRCSNTEEHEWHSWVTVQDTECSGQTPCGEMNHSPHTYKETINVWCEGICKCGRKDLHGMGDHK